MAFHPLTVTAVRRETRDSVVLSLAPPPGQEAAFRFTQGQYLTLRAEIDGAEVRRSYSICAGTQDAALRIGIKRVGDGVFSGWAHGIAPGQVIEAMTPAGSFHVPLDPAHRKHYAGFAAGSGITPLLSIIKTTLAVEPLSRFSLFYGNRASSTIMFREELEDLKNQHIGRFSLTHILSREQQDVPLFNGRLGRAKCEELFARWFDPATVDTAFICGPQDMMQEVADSLQAHGLDRSRIRFELFGTAGAPRPARPEAAAAAGLCQATIVLDGRARQLAIPRGATTILDAALAEGLDVPYACKAGVCSTCRAMLLDGQADMDANYALEEYEIARGYILTCQAYPASTAVTVDYDR